MGNCPVCVCVYVKSLISTSHLYSTMWYTPYCQMTASYYTMCTKPVALKYHLIIGSLHLNIAESHECLAYQPIC